MIMLNLFEKRTKEKDLHDKLIEQLSLSKGRLESVYYVNTKEFRENQTISGNEFLFLASYISLLYSFSLDTHSDFVLSKLNITTDNGVSHFLITQENVRMNDVFIRTPTSSKNLYTLNSNLIEKLLSLYELGDLTDMYRKQLMGVLVEGVTIYHTHKKNWFSTLMYSCRIYSQNEQQVNLYQLAHTHEDTKDPILNILVKQLGCDIPRSKKLGLISYYKLLYTDMGDSDYLAVNFNKELRTNVLLNGILNDIFEYQLRVRHPKMKNKELNTLKENLYFEFMKLISNYKINCNYIVSLIYSFENAYYFEKIYNLINITKTPEYLTLPVTEQSKYIETFLDKVFIDDYKELNQATNSVISEMIKDLSK